MFTCYDKDKIFQTLPGQGWRVLIEWNMEPEDVGDGFPAATLEPVIAWVTLRVARDEDTKDPYGDVVIAPLVRYPSGDGLVILDSHYSSCSFLQRKFIYLAPGEEVNEQHVNQLRHGSYAAGVTLV